MWDNADRSRTCQVAPEVSDLQRENEALRRENAELRRQAEQTVCSFDERFSVMAESAQDAILMMDPRGRITFYNQTATIMFGWTADEAIGKDLHTLMAPPRYHEAYHEGLAHFRQTGQGPAVGKTLELTALHKDGTEFPIEISLAAVTHNHEWHALGIVRNITERKRTEQMLRESERQLRDVLDSIVAGIVIIDPETHTIVDVNESGAAMVGASRADVIGKTCHKFICPSERGQCPIADRQQRMDESERVLLRADGSTLPIIKSAREGTFRGRPCLVESFVPIVKQKKVEHELKESLSLIQATLDSTADGILVVGCDARIKTFNARFKDLTHLPGDLATSGDGNVLTSYGTRWVKDPDQFTAAIAEIKDHPEQERLDTIEFIDGTVLERSCRPYVIEDRIVGHVMSFHDITDRYNAQKEQDRLMRQVAAVNEELTHFAYVVSHDLKAPLRGIKLLTEWLCADYGDKLGDDAKEQLDLLQSRVERMHNLIEGVLQYSRVGRIKEDAVSIDLDELLADIIDTIAPPEHICITVQGPLPTIRNERTRIIQVFQNLLTNAVKYMDKPQGQITVACDDDGDTWKFSIRDNGPGIEEKYFERIFRIFQTLAPKDEFESTGVGLTLVKKIVELYGGKVWVESAVGQGSTFFFTLPKQAAPTPDETSAGAASQNDVDRNTEEA